MFPIKLMFSVKFLTGAAVGYLLGARAGREQYDRVLAKVDAGKDQMVQQVREHGGEVIEKAREHGAEVIEKAREHGAEVVEKVKDKTPFGSDGEADSFGPGAGPSQDPAAERAVADGHPMHASGRG
jgi:hypothetical protein